MIAIYIYDSRVCREETARAGFATQGRRRRARQCCQSTTSKKKPSSRTRPRTQNSDHVSQGSLRLRKPGARPPAGRAARFRVGGGERCRKYSGRAEQSDRLLRRTLHWGSLRISWGDRRCCLWVLGPGSWGRRAGGGCQDSDPQWVSVWRTRLWRRRGCVRNHALGTGMRDRDSEKTRLWGPGLQTGLRERGRMWVLRHLRESGLRGTRLWGLSLLRG